MRRRRRWRLSAAEDTEEWVSFTPDSAAATASGQGGSFAVPPPDLTTAAPHQQPQTADLIDF